jgi:hypothetical protein
MPILLYFLGDRFQLWRDAQAEPHLTSALAAILAVGLGNAPVLLFLPSNPLGVKLDAVGYFVFEGLWTWWFVRLLTRLSATRNDGPQST